MDQDKKSKKKDVFEIKNKKIDLKEFIQKARAARSTFKNEDLQRFDTASTT